MAGAHIATDDLRIENRRETTMAKTVTEGRRPDAAGWYRRDLPQPV